VSAARGRIAVAASGGRDSTALLHATARAARSTHIEVHALHVHHGLLAQADDWVAHLQRQCKRWHAAGLPVHLHVTRLEDKPAPGDSVEAWARRERYRALGAMARALGIETVLLAHHRQDQAETLLLQALRGAGAAGLAGMPAQALRDGICWCRPWLTQRRTAIEAYVRRYRLHYVNDDSNADPRFARNRLRLSIWPPLLQAFPDAEAALAAAAKRAQEAAACASALAAIDKQACTDDEGRLCVNDWSTLESARRANLLRAWLARHLPEGVPDSLVQRLMVELLAKRPASWPSAAGPLHLRRGLLQFTSGTEKRSSDVSRIDLSRPGHYGLPQWGGVLIVSDAQGQGVSPQLLANAELKPREGGEQFQRTPRSTPRSLKKQFQAQDVAAWERDGPLVYAGARLLFVPGLGIDGRVLAGAGEAGLRLQWQRSPRP
jgi:tRNA(Ile)-lysidine synthase